MYQSCLKKTKKARKLKKALKCKVRVSKKRYEIESEIGSLQVQAHELIGTDGKRAFSSIGGFLPAIAPKERFRSARYKQLQYNLIATGSCRETAAMLNRIRLQDDGAKPTTVRNQAEREGMSIHEAKIGKAQVAFQTCGFDADGHKKPETSLDFSQAMLKIANYDAVSKASQELAVSTDFKDYEAIDCAVNISVDEVCCKQQSAKRPCVNRENEPKQIKNTVVHVQKGNNSYVLTGETVSEAIRLLVGFLLSNGLLGAYPLVFFADGARIIKNTVEEYFQFAPYKYILDWPHLTKKTAELLSSAINGRKKRNEIHEKLKQLLWRGDITAAIAFLDTLPVEDIKSADWLVQLKNYLERNRTNIPCYAMRKRLGLRVSSNLGEKANDRVVSSRQKHNGMAWSREGSFALASICVTQLNAEMNDWLFNHSVRFDFDSTKAA